MTQRLSVFIAAVGGVLHRSTGIFILACAALAPVEAANAVDAEHLSHLLVRTRSDATGADVDRAHARAGVVSVDWACRSVPGLCCVSVPTSAAVKALASLRADPTVLYAEPDYPRHKLGQNIPYGVTKVDAPLEWPKSRGAGVIVAHLDTGVDLNHPDLPTPALAQSFVDGVSSVQDGDGHGTHTAGTIVARDNGLGVVGVAPAATLIVAKVLDDSGGGGDANLIAGIDWAVQNHARVISMSLGGYDSSAALRDACAAAKAAGAVVVAAAGNDGISTPSYPAAFRSVVSVVAVDSTNNLAEFNNFGPSIDLAAPGVGVRSTYVGGPYVFWVGDGHDAGLMLGGGDGTVAGNAVYCGYGEAAAAFPAAVSGQIAHIRRGGPGSQAVTFQTKVQNAVTAGAIGVVISNNVAGHINGTLSGSVSIPVLEITKAEGDALQGRTGLHATLCTSGCSTYFVLDGTSMSCPHVAGVAALLFAAVPAATPDQVITAMKQTALDLGAPGRDDLYGFGLVRADLAARYLKRHQPKPQLGSASASEGPRDASDLYSFLDDYLAGSAAADANDDGRVGVDDLLAYVGEWFSGG